MCMMVLCEYPLLRSYWFTNFFLVDFSVHFVFVLNIFKWGIWNLSSIEIGGWSRAWVKVEEETEETEAEAEETEAEETEAPLGK